MLAITGVHAIVFLLALLLLLVIIDFFTVPVTEDPPGDKFNPYREDYEDGFDADYEANNKWSKKYEHMN
jgi:hypothetical protein